MNPYWTNGRAVLWQGHVLDALAAMEAGSVHCAITSPPYWGLRDYGLPPIEWPPVSYAPMAGLPEIEIPGCDPECGHVWADAPKSSQRIRNGASGGLADDGRTKEIPVTLHPGQGQYCQLCSGWRGCLGLEPTVEMFVGHIVLVARALWRVLRDDGTFWLNFGDSYSGSWGNYAPGGIKNEQRPRTESGARYERPAYSSTTFKPPTANAGNLKPKDLIGIPWRVAFALQADGWYLRSDIIWAKGVSFCPTYSGSCMPESVTDRPTKGHEYVFLLSKNKRYFYDGDAVREAAQPSSIERYKYPFDGSGYHEGNSDPKGGGFRGAGMTQIKQGNPPAGRNLRTVWTINPGSYAGAHFATFPPALVEPMIKAGTSAKGCCPECGAPWERVTERERAPTRPGDGRVHWDASRNDGGIPLRPELSVTTTGWIPTCSCGTCSDLDLGGDAVTNAPFAPVPCVVLDPFLGSGTTADVARQLGRRWVGIELNKEYCDDHIIPRLTEPLFEWAQQEQEQEPEPVIEQLEMQL